MPKRRLSGVGHESFFPPKISIFVSFRSEKRLQFHDQEASTRRVHGVAYELLSRNPKSGYFGVTPDFRVIYGNLRSLRRFVTKFTRNCTLPLLDVTEALLPGLLQKPFYQGFTFSELTKEELRFFLRGMQKKKRGIQIPESRDRGQPSSVILRPSPLRGHRSPPN